MDIRPNTLALERRAKIIQRAFHGSLLPSRWNKIPASIVDTYFISSPTEIVIWVDLSTRKVGLDISTKPTTGIIIGYLTNSFYELLLKYLPPRRSGAEPTFEETRVNDGVALCIGRDGADIVVIIDAYFGGRRALHGGDGGDNLTPCKIPNG